MGPGHNPGIQNRFPRGAFSIFTPEVGHPVSSRAESHSGGAPVNASERGCNGATPVRGNSGVLLQPIPSPQEGRRHETSNKFEESQRVHCPSPFQNGRDTYPEASPEERRLDDKGGSKGRLFHDPYPPVRQTISPFLCPESSLSVQLPAIRPVLCSLGLYQDPEASNFPAQRAWGKASGIHRRHLDHGRIGGTSEGPHPRPDLPVGEPGVHNTPSEEGNYSYPADRVPGNASALPDTRAAPSRSENKEASLRDSKATRFDSPSHSSGGVTPTGQTEFSFSGSPPRSSILQNDTERPSSSTGQGRPVVRDALPTVGCSKGGTYLVDTQLVQVEREEPGSEEPRADPIVGRIPHRLGSIMSGSSYWGSMVPSGEELPYQLPGAPGRFAGGEDLLERSIQQANPAVARQPDSSFVHKQSGRDCLRPSSDIS